MMRHTGQRILAGGAALLGVALMVASLNRAVDAQVSGGPTVVTNAGTFQTQVTQINGVAPSMGSGANGTGVQRFTIATDDEINDDLDTIASGFGASGSGINVKIAGSDPLAEVTSATLQSAATANGNGTLLTVNGYGTVILTVNCSGCSGGTLVNFEVSQNATNYVAVSARSMDATTNAPAKTTSTSGITHWQVPVSGWQHFRASISNYSAGTVTVTGRAVFGAPAATTGGCAPAQLISAASTNATSVKASAGQIYTLHVVNTNAAIRYLKLYNKASAPTVGTDTPVQTLGIPAATTGGGFVLPIAVGMEFSTGIALALTTGVAVADTGAVAANEITVNYCTK